MEINLQTKEKTAHKVGDVVQGISGNFYLIVQDAQSNEYRCVNLKTGSINFHSEDTIEELLNCLNLQETHIPSENLKLTTK
ncbi:hypothetical protein CON64_18605 [Bacillus pseudomycoides]|nr:hypothetical protein CON64_18605 [Bacillus pseudomycoides]